MWYPESSVGKTKRRNDGRNTQVWKAVYTLNHLTACDMTSILVIVSHFLSLQDSGKETRSTAHVFVKDLFTRQWQGPWELLTWGHACVSSDCSPWWIPTHCIQPALNSDQEKSHLDSQADTVAKINN